MKALKIGGLLASLTILILFSCGKDHSKELVRTWTVTNIETQTSLPDSVKAKMMSDSEMMFSKDGNYTVNGGIGADQGTYTLDKEGKTLSTVSTAGKSNSVYTIDKLTEDELVLNQSGNTVTYVAKK